MTLATLSLIVRKAFPILVAKCDTRRGYWLADARNYGAMDKHEERVRRHENLLVWMLSVAAVSLLAAAAWYFWNFHGGIADDQARWGQFGDYMGGLLNPLFALFALFALYYTVVLQVRELHETRVEIAKTVTAAKHQTFEGTFFQLLRLHAENVATIHLAVNETDPFKLASQSTKDVHGRVALHRFVLLLEDTIAKEPEFEDLDQKPVEPIQNIRMGFDKFYRDFGPDLGNYFVTVHEVMSFIEQCPDEEIDLTMYARLFRSQLASWEALLIAYYCIADQHLSESMTKLVKDYGILHFLEPAAFERVQQLGYFDETAFAS